jgi:RHS repeat-associated protein
VTLFEYDALGAQTRSGLDVNGNGTLDLAGPDRVTESRSWYETDASNNYWQASASILYPHDGSAAPVTNAVQKTQLTGLGGPGAPHAVSLSKDILGNTTLSRTFIDRDSKIITQTTTYPDSTNAAISVTINGLTQYTISKTGIRTDYAYDALMRPISQIGPKTASFTHFNSLGQVDWVADALSNRTTFTYCPTTGRRISVTDALSNTTHTAYDPEGRVIATWGATYPVAYAYDAYGRMVVMATFRVEGGAGDQTQWLYDEATGLLTNKVYADGKGPSYTYTPDGKLATRTWARGVTTTYAYDTASGAMTNIAYSDGTPAVGFTLDRLGRQVAITDATGTRTFTYNAALQLASETNAFGVLVRAYDGLGRTAGFSLFNPANHVNPVQSISYGYDPLGRFQSVSSSVFSVSSVVNYSHLPGTDLLSGWSSPTGHAVTRAFEPHRDLLTAVSNRYNDATVSAFDYINDAIARRTQRIDTGRAGPPDPPVTNLFGYNPRSELTSAAMGTNSYGYAFDPIGNRELERVNLNTNFYAANALNQYTAVSNGVAWAPEYDADGNLLKLRNWTLQWDAENRLVSASNSTEVIRYQHDYMGRRVWRAASGVTNRFDYDGRALIRDRTYYQTHTLTNSYVYGLDLSGTLQGAGTIGGLLARVDEDGTLYYTYDGNGNVSDLVDDTGTIRGHYEYAPFGGLTAMTGDLAESNPFRFSTKRQDDSTGLLYYGYRDLDTVWGRWVSRDPIGLYGCVNLFGFARNAALNHIDLFGLVVPRSYESGQIHYGQELWEERLGSVWDRHAGVARTDPDWDPPAAGLGGPNIVIGKVDSSCCCKMTIEKIAVYTEILLPNEGVNIGFMPGLWYGFSVVTAPIKQVAYSHELAHDAHAKALLYTFADTLTPSRTCCARRRWGPPPRLTQRDCDRAARKLNEWMHDEYQRVYVSASVSFHSKPGGKSIFVSSGVMTPTGVTQVETARDEVLAEIDTKHKPIDWSCSALSGIYWPW